MYDLCIIIPARNEMFLDRTIKDIISNIRGNTEIIVVLDGDLAEPPIEDHPLVTLIYHSTSIGQRAATNEAARLTEAKYIMKCDAHCAFDEGFDVKMMEMMRDNWTMVPIMRNLHVFDWVCKKCGDRRYQGPTPIKCNREECDGTEFERDVVWIAKTNPQSTSYCFDSEPHFQYFNEYKRRITGHRGITETMSLQGSCFMVTREKYFELDLCSEEFPSWGSQGIEVACKTWLSGGRVVCNHKTWYAHMFRTQGGDFGFPWPASGRSTEKAKLYARDLFFNNKWPKAKRPLSWLIRKFAPVPGWDEEKIKQLESRELPLITFDAKDLMKEMPSIGPEVERPSIGFLYYTDNRLDNKIDNAVRSQVIKCAKACGAVEIISVSLKPIDFGTNVVLPLERGYLTMFKQQFAGIEAATADVLFMVEHDILYNPSHFSYIPPREDVFYYNQNRWHVDAKSGHALFYHAESVSQMCAYRKLLLEHYRTRVERVEREGFTRRLGFEPGNHPFPRGVDFYTRDVYWSDIPNIDIRHSYNLTWSRWKKEQFRNQRTLYAWTEADEVPGWGRTKDNFESLLDKIIKGEM